MSVLPMLFSNWWEDLDSPHRVFDQYFGMNIDPDYDLDNIAPIVNQALIYRPNRLISRSRYRPYITNRKNRGSSTIQKDKDKFMVTLDVQQFSPDEINVKVQDKSVIVEAKHEEKEDEHGWISRQFVRKYIIPAQCDIDKVESRLSSDGVLTITAPRKRQQTESNERQIQIQYTGQPALNQVTLNGNSDAIQNDEQGRNPKNPNPTQQRGRKGTVKST